MTQKVRMVRNTVSRGARWGEKDAVQLWITEDCLCNEVEHIHLKIYPYNYTAAPAEELLFTRDQWADLIGA